MAEVGGRLVERFATNLAAQLAAGAGAGGDGEAGGEPAESTAAGNGAGPGAAVPGPAPAGEAGAAPGPGGAAPIEELNLPVRAFNSLRREGIHTVADLSARSEQQLLAIDNLGPASLKEIKQKLADRGLTLSVAGTAPGGAAGEATAGAAAPGRAGTRTSVPADGLSGDGASAGRRQAGAAADGTFAGPTPLRAARPPDEDAIDLLSVAGFPVLKRLLPVAAVVVIALLFFLRVMSRRSAKE
jgi:hypothetical protein